MPTTKFLEPGTDATFDFSFFQSTTTTAKGTVASDSTVAHTGPRSLQTAISAVANNAYVTSPNGVVSDAGAAISLWAYFSSAAPTSATTFVQTATSGGSLVNISVGIDTNGTIAVQGLGAATKKNGATVLIANTWYRVTLAYVITSASNWSAVIFLNGTSEVTTGNADGTLTNVGSSTVKFGIQKSGSAFNTSAILTEQLDDIYIDDRTDQTDPGNIRVTAKRPNANGTSNQFTTEIGAGGSGYGTGHSPQVNERALNTANGWLIATGGVAKTEEYQIEGRSVGDVDISGATIKDYAGWVYTSALAAETGNLILNNVNTSIAVTTTNTLFTAFAGSSIYPAGTGTDIGESTATTNTTVSLYECGVLVAYFPGLLLFPPWPPALNVLVRM